MASGGEERRSRVSQILGSDSLDECACEPCEADGKLLDAWGYCEQCDEFLCQDCFICHTRPTVTRNHTLIERKHGEKLNSFVENSRKQSLKSNQLEISNSLPAYTPSPSHSRREFFRSNSYLAGSSGEIRDADRESVNSEFSKSMLDHSSSMRRKLTEICPEHTGEPIKYYCRIHDQLGCEVCVTTNHRNCENVGYIPTVSKNFQSQKEYTDFISKVQFLERSAKTMVSKLEKASKVATQSHALAKISREKFRKDIDNILDKMMTALDEHSTDLEKEECERIDNIAGGCRVILDKVQTVEGQLKALQNNDCGVYITLKRFSRQMSSLEAYLGIAAKDEARECVFIPGKNLLKAMREENAFGKVTYQPDRQPEVSLVKDIKVRTSSDIQECWITGLVMLSKDKFVAIDNKNRKVKLVDIKKGKVISWCKISNQPWDIAKISDSRMAVTVPEEERIGLIQVTNTVTIDTDIKVSGHCYGVTYTDDILIVSFLHTFPDKVELMNLRGQVLKSITVNTNGDWLFRSPRYVSLSVTGQTIFISNWDDHTIHSLALDGSFKSTYKDDGLITPGKLTQEGRHRLVVTDHGSNQVLMVDLGTSKTVALLTSNNGLVGPSSVCFDDETDRLLVGMEKSVIKVFKLQ